MQASEEDILAKLPGKLASCLMPFQRDGVVFAIKKKGRCLIADEMGLGKTLQAIAVAAFYREAWPLLIIVPSSLRYVWIEELEKWLPDVHPQKINLIQGGFDTGGISHAEVTLVTYGLLSSKAGASVRQALAAQKFKIIVCDESHYFKNSRTECWKAVEPLGLAATHCILLSGTPTLARPAELFTQISMLLPKSFGSWWSFTKHYCAGHWEYFGKKRRWRTEGASNLDNLQGRLQTVMIRREKKDVLAQLPQKQRQKILFHLKESKTKKEILGLFSDLKPLLKKSSSSVAVNLLGDKETTLDADPEVIATADKESKGSGILCRIRQLYSLTGEAKIGPVREYIQMLCENECLKFLVFCYHHCMMDGVQQVLWEKNVKFVRIDGNTKPSDRQMFVEEFQNTENTRVAILSILAAGVGLTLTAARLVVFAELYWTPGVMLQCEDRAHRIGQTSTVPIHYLVAQDTMDEWVWSAVCRKTLVTSAALNGRSQALDTHPGDQYQVELLSSADSYTPTDITPCQDVAVLLQSQRPPDQKSILDFFASQSSSHQNDCSKNEPIASAFGSDTNISRKLTKKKAHNQSKSLKLSSCSSVPVGQDAITVDSSDEDFKADFLEVSFSVHRRKRRIETCWSGDEASVSCAKDAEDFSGEDPVGFIVQEEQQPSKKRKTCLPSLEKENLQDDSCGSTSLNQGDDDVQDEVQVVEHDWSCAICTFSNHALLPFCEMCDTPRKKKKRTGHRSDKTSQHLQDDVVQNDNAALLGIATSSTSCISNDCVLLLPQKSTDTLDLPREEKPTFTIQVFSKQDNVSSQDGMPLSADMTCQSRVSSSHNVSSQSEIPLSADMTPHWSGGPSSPAAPLTVFDIPGNGGTSAVGSVHKFFQFCCSTYTGRVYIFNESGESLEANFLPLDVELGNLTTLPAFLQHPHHLYLLRTFVRQWNSLTDTKRRLISKKGVIFTSPLAAYDFVRTDKSNNMQRYKSKEDILTTAVEKATEVKGYVRKVSRSKPFSIPITPGHVISPSAAPESDTFLQNILTGPGTYQVVSASRVPLCLQCQKPCTVLMSATTVCQADLAWQTRFCSRVCADAHWMKTSTSYIRSSIYDIQHGVCQMCQFDAHAFFCRIRDMKDHKKRAEMINKSKFSRAGLGHKKQMITKPSEGLFWHVDHIRPVWDGGGQCDIDNLRTLCTPCHLMVTSRQTGKRVQAHRLSTAAMSGDITAFFKKS